MAAARRCSLLFETVEADVVGAFLVMDGSMSVTGSVTAGRFVDSHASIA